MSMRECIVCHRKVPQGYEQDHLGANHLGPHLWWYNAKQYQTMEPSMAVYEIKRMADWQGAGYQFFQETADGVWQYYGDGESVDLTNEPHFYAIPPATMFG